MRSRGWRIVSLAAVASLLLGGCGPALRWPTGRMFPQFAPIRQLDVLTVPSSTPAAEQLGLASLEGLINRPRPRLYTVGGADDTFWLQHALPGVHTQTLTVPDSRQAACQEPLQVVDAPMAVPMSLLCTVLRRFPGVVHGLVVYDPAVEGSVDVATTLAGIDQAMVVSPLEVPFFTAAPFHLKVLADLTQQHWTSDLQAYMWEFANLWPKTQHRLLFSLDPHIAMNLREYAVATNGFVFWLDPTDSIQKALLTRILEQAAPDTPVLGWWTNEPPGVGLASQYRHFTVATDFADNLSVFGAFPEPSHLRQSAPPPLPSLGNRIYYSIQFSDGDNVQYMQHHLRQLWQDPQRTHVPVAFTIQPWAAEIIPTILEYYYATAGPDSFFTTGPSGPGYFYPQDWPATDLVPFLRLGAGLLAREDLKDVEVWNYGASSGPELAAYAQVLHPSALLLGMGGNGSISTLDGTVAVVNLGSPNTVQQAAGELQALQGAPTVAVGGNLASGLRPVLGSAAPAGSQLAGNGATFTQAPTGAVNHQEGLEYRVPLASSGGVYRVAMNLSGHGQAVLDLWNGSNDTALSYTLSSTPQTGELDVHVPANSRTLDVALVPSGGSAQIEVSGLSVVALEPPAITQPQFVNVYVDAWSFTPSMVAQLAAELGPDYQLVRLDQLLELWHQAQKVG